MIGKENIIKIARAFVRKDQGIPDSRMMHPARDWFIGLSIASLLFIIAVVHTGFDFLYKLKTIDQMPEPQSSVVIYRQKEVAEVLKNYSEREHTFNALRASAQKEVPEVDEAFIESESEILADELIAQ